MQKNAKIICTSFMEYPKLQQQRNETLLTLIVAHNRRTMKLKNAVGAMGKQVELLSGKVGAIAAKYSEKSHNTERLRQEVEQVVDPFSRKQKSSSEHWVISISVAATAGASGGGSIEAEQYALGQTGRESKSI